VCILRTYDLISDLEEESIVFHDAVEDVADLSDEDESAMIRSQTPRASDDPEMSSLRNKLAALHRKRARIRTKKVCFCVLPFFS
jgi:hypothetical protein